MFQKSVVNEIFSTDKLYLMALERYSNELPHVKLTEQKKSSIWCSIYGIIQHEGEEKAKEYVKTAKLLK